MKVQHKPLGIRNNNPGNIEWGSPWQGLLPEFKRTDPRFAQFANPVDGIRAIAVTLITYQDKRRARDGSRIDSILEVIERWAPPEDENPTQAYARGVAKLIDGVEHDEEVIDMHYYGHLRPIVEGIIRHENGKGPLNTVNSWYADDVIDEALRRAGVAPEAKAITAQAVVPAGVATAGAAQLADSLPTVMLAMQDADSHFTSGSVVRVIFGAAIVGVAGYIAWQQYRKAKIGAA
jgi:hypothetical protein